MFDRSWLGDGVDAVLAGGLNRTSGGTAGAVFEFCFGPLSANPRRVGKALARNLAGYCAARHGDYPVIYRVDEIALTAHVVRIEHRGDVYRPH